MVHFVLPGMKTSHIVHQLIFKAREGRKRKRGPIPCQFWWDQSMELDRTRDASDFELDLFWGGQSCFIVVSNDDLWGNMLTRLTIQWEGYKGLW